MSLPTSFDVDNNHNRHHIALHRKYNAAVKDVRDFGALGDGLTDDTQAIQDAIDAAHVTKGTGRVILPGGQYLVSSPIRLRGGVLLEGSGSHSTTNQPGSTIDGSGITSGPVVYTDTDEMLHHGGFYRLRIMNGPEDGIWIKGGMGECSIMEYVYCPANGQDGIHISGSSTPLHIGHISVHGNGRAGLHLERQTYTHVQVTYVAGDNNGKCLVWVNGLDQTGTVQILGWKSERWNSGIPGNPDVFVLTNTNGAVVDLGSGRVHLGSGVTNGDNIVKQEADEGAQTGSVLWQVISLNKTSGPTYTNVYNDTRNSIVIATGSDYRWRGWRISQGPTMILKNRADAGSLLMTLNDTGLGSGSVAPESSIVAGPGSVYLRSNGYPYLKASGTGNTGWELMPRTGAANTFAATQTFGGAWDGAHIVLGAYHLWVDATGDLRIKSGAPTGDTDGAVVGAQS